MSEAEVPDKDALQRLLDHAKTRYGMTREELIADAELGDEAYLNTAAELEMAEAYYKDLEIQLTASPLADGPEIECLCGDIFPTAEKMHEHLHLCHPEADHLVSADTELDVERLARAMQMYLQIGDWLNGGIKPEAALEVATRLAAEYARLSAPQDDPACDYCLEGLPKDAEGWHLRVDPEGIEGTQRIPCPRAGHP